MKDKMVIRDKYGSVKYVDVLCPRSAKELLDTEIVKPEEIIDGLLPVGASIMAGEPKCGKSYVIMQMVIAIAGGKPFLGCKTHKSRVLYCDLESPDWLHQQRMDMLCDEDDVLANIDVFTQSNRADIGNLGEGFEDQIACYLDGHHDCKLVVVDTLGQIMTAGTVEDTGSGGQYVKEKEAYDRLITMARDRKVGILVVDHTTKSNIGKDPFKAIRGTYATAGSYDTLMVLSVPNQEDTTYDNVQCRRLSVKGKAVAEQDIRITLDDNLCIVNATTSLQYEKEKRKRNYQASILRKYLKYAVENLGMLRGTASDVLDALKKYGYTGDITSDGLGKWFASNVEEMREVDNLAFSKKRTSSNRLIEIRFEDN